MNTSKKVPYGKKQYLIREWLRKGPHLTNQFIAQTVGCHDTYVGVIRRDMKKRSTVPSLQDEGDILTSKPPTDTIAPGANGLLTTRHHQYGTFEVLAKVATDIKGAVRDGVETNGYTLEPDHLEALDLIATKMARAACGDPNIIDTWLDIAGYAMLVVKRLEGKPI